MPGLLTVDWITKESVRVLMNELGFSKNINRQYDSMWAKEGAKGGASLRIRKPPRYLTTTGATLTEQVSDEDSATVTLAQEHVGLGFTTIDLTLSIDAFSDRFIKPAIASLANKIDFDGFLQYRDVYNISGTIGAGVPTTLGAYLKAKKFLTQEATPQSLRCMAINADHTAEIVDALRGLFHSGKEIASQYEKGLMGEAIGFKWVEDENARQHTTGTRAGTPLVNEPGGVAEGDTTIDIDGLGATETVKRGDIFTIASVNAVNPQNRQSTGVLRNFVVTADATASGGAVTLSISPLIRSTGKDQTVDALPADNAVVTFNGGVSAKGHQGLAFHRDAFVLGMADLEMPDGVDFKGRVSSPDLGVSLRIIRQYSITSDKIQARVDALYGWKAVRPEMACRITT